MRTLSLAVIALALVGGAWAVASHPQAATDFEAYVAERRAAGMSEGAEIALQRIAAVRAKSLLLTYEKDASGIYARSYSSAFCARPGSESQKIAKLQERSRQIEAAELRALQKIADTDGSGFVSTAEGQRFDHLVEFAWEATFVAGQEGRDFDRVARAMGMPVELFRNNLKEYRELLRRIGGGDPRLKDVPL